MQQVLRKRVGSSPCDGRPQWSGNARRRSAVTAVLLTDVATASAVKVKVPSSPERAVADERPIFGQPNGLKQHVPTVQRHAEPVTLAMLNDVRTMFSSLLKEYAYWIDDAWVTGTIPAELYGTYYRNGPALHVTNPRYNRHTLDGDGMVFSIAFKDGQAYFRNRYVRTKGFVAEQAAGRPLLRNSFTRGATDGSSHFNPFDLNFKNVANTGVLPWAGQLYALWEAGLPYLMDPRSLATHRETRMAGQIRTNTFAAHYRIITEDDQPQQQHNRHNLRHQQHHHDQPKAAVITLPESTTERVTSAAGASSSNRAGGSTSTSSGSSTTTSSGSSTSRRRLVTFSNDFGFSGARAVFYEFDEGGQLLHETAHTLPGVDLAVIHDMVVTEHYYVLVVGPMKLDPIKFATKYLLGRCSIAECLVYDPQQQTRIMLFPRPGRPSGKVLQPRVLTADPFFVFHNVNGFEAEGGQVVVLDTVAWDEVSFDMDLFDKDNKRVDGFEGGARTQLTRLTCDLRSGRVDRRKLLQRTVEFPATDPRVTSRPHRVSWFIADAIDDPVRWGPAQSIVRLELDPAATLAPAPAAALRRAPQRLEPPRRAASADCGEAASAAAPGVSVDSWYLPPRTFPGEPMFIPRPGSLREGDGWLLVATHNAATEKADVHIFDAEALSAGPLATLHLPHRLPVSLHGAWDATYQGPDPEDGTVPRWQELGSVRPM